MLFSQATLIYCRCTIGGFSIVNRKSSIINSNSAQTGYGAERIESHEFGNRAAREYGSNNDEVTRIADASHLSSIRKFQTLTAYFILSAFQESIRTSSKLSGYFLCLSFNRQPLECAIQSCLHRREHPGAKPSDYPRDKNCGLRIINQFNPQSAI